MARDEVLDWLLEEEQPSVRARALTELVGLPASDPDVREARRRIPEIGWARTILDARSPGGWWESERSTYVPKYLGTSWRLIALAGLGASRETPEIAESVDLWVRASRKSDGGFGPEGYGKGHECTTGNTVRSLLQLGYPPTDARVRPGLVWLVDHADPKGGWSCYGSGRNLDGWEPLSAFAALPRDVWNPSIERTATRASEFFLERELHAQGAPYAPWGRTHYPHHYYYDLLVGLDVLTALGYGADPRLDHAIAWLNARQRPDGRWNLDAVHPDVEGSTAEWIRRHPKRAPVPLVLESPGAPSKFVTLAARRVLQRVAEARPRRVGRTTPAAPPETPPAASPGTTGPARRAPRRARTS